MALSKKELRQALRDKTGNLNWPIDATAVGTTSTFIDSRWNDVQEDFVAAWWAVALSSPIAGEYRPIASVSSTNPKTFTVEPAFSGIWASGGDGEIGPYFPPLYTKAINLAIIEAYKNKYLFTRARDNTLIWVAADYEYTLPSGFTPDNIVSVMFEGEGSYDNIPTTPVNPQDYEYSYDDTKIVFFRRSSRFYEPPAGRIIYLQSEKQLTMLAEDTVLGTLTTDTSSLVELTADTVQEDLLLDFAAAKLYELLAREPGFARKVEAEKLAQEWMAKAINSAENGAAMRRLERVGFRS